MGREIRRVPPDWEHPRHAGGRFVPLFPGPDFAERVEEWDRNKADWEAGRFPKYADEEDRLMPFEEWVGARPNPEDYMPTWPDEVATKLMLYETTSEGTPCMPRHHRLGVPLKFDDIDSLCAWAAENCCTFAHMTATAEEWKRMLGGLFAVESDCGRILFL